MQLHISAQYDVLVLFHSVETLRCSFTKLCYKAHTVTGFVNHIRLYGAMMAV